MTMMNAAERISIPMDRWARMRIAIVKAQEMATRVTPEAKGNKCVRKLLHAVYALDDVFEVPD